MAKSGHTGVFPFGHDINMEAKQKEDFSNVRIVIIYDFLSRSRSLLFQWHHKFALIGVSEIKFFFLAFKSPHSNHAPIFVDTFAASLHFKCQPCSKVCLDFDTSYICMYICTPIHISISTLSGLVRFQICHFTYMYAHIRTFILSLYSSSGLCCRISRIIL
jgi:hypothetical protein